MSSLRSSALACVALFAAVAPSGVASAAPQGQYQLVWSDEFDGAALDPAKWEALIGTGCPSLCGWGNNELQFYRAENAVVGGGVLRIVAREESFGGRAYTSARLRTRGLADFERGRFEMRAKLPSGRGLWPAFWMFPTDSVYGTWAASGEIDIVELVGHEPDRIHGTIHFGAQSPGNTSAGGSYALASGEFADDFHDFALEWDETELRWYVDGVLYNVETSWWSSGGPFPAPFDQRFHLLLNLAVGGNWPGPPSTQTQFPAEFVVDHVRVYEATPTGEISSYCVGGVNSRGVPGAILHQGTASIAQDDLVLLASNVIPGGFGIFFYGPQPTDLPFGDGRLCVDAPHSRLLPAVAADSIATVARPLDLSSPPASEIVAGSTYHFQFWYRDAAGGAAGFNATDGLRVTFAP